ncbi:MAG: Hsp20 family protein [Pseudomonadota bacterium]
MNTIDLSPLYRTMVGFDRMANMIDSASRLDGAQGYPPYNIERIGDDQFAIELAVAGFGEADLDIEVKESLLTVAGKKDAPIEGEERDFLHRGIAERGFIRRFQLADHVVVDGASLENGLLRVELRRELPETAKPRKISIGDQTGPKLISKTDAA